MKILVADDDSSIRKAIEYDFKEKEINGFFARDGKEAQDIFDKYEPGIVVLDIKMPKLDGIQLLKYILGKAPETKVLMISAHGTIELAVSAMKTGAEDFIVKPFSLDELSRKIKKLSEQYLHPEKSEEDNMYGESEVFKAFREQLVKVAKVNSTVLLTGESGTGKELAARYIHRQSQRSEGDFVAVNCATLSNELLSSELFGHRRGSFTGAAEDREGKFIAASGGTIFLDEVSEIDTELQAKMLRVLQEGEVEVIGESMPKKVDARVIAATNRNIEEEVREGRFREDLFYRLNVINIKVPSLCERLDDIAFLSTKFLEDLNQMLGTDYRNISEEAMHKLSAYHWPGNIRQLRNALERAMVFSDDDSTLMLEDFDFLIDDREEGEEKDKLEQNEKDTILEYMKNARNKTDLAKKLGIKRTTLLYKLKKYEIDF
ncbi:MAG: sigma-54-dependent transcriptional regulator [Candidatus Muiribacteriaceae bacterium]